MEFQTFEATTTRPRGRDPITPEEQKRLAEEWGIHIDELLPRKLPTTLSTVSDDDSGNGKGKLVLKKDDIPPTIRLPQWVRVFITKCGYPAKTKKWFIRMARARG